MTRSRKNRLVDGALLLLLCLTILSLSGPRSNHELDIRTCLHASAGFVLTLGVFVHIGLHGRQFRSAFSRRNAKKKARAAIWACITLFLLLAFFSGFFEIASPKVNLLHHAAGLLALFGLAAHTVRHLTVLHVWLKPGRLNARSTMHRASPDPRGNLPHQKTIAVRACSVKERGRYQAEGKRAE